MFGRNIVARQLTDRKRLKFFICEQFKRKDSDSWNLKRYFE